MEERAIRRGRWTDARSGGEYARLEQLKEAGIDVEVEEANRRLSTDGDNHRSGQSSPSPRASRKRKASDVVVASSDDMSWIEKYPGCELGVPEPYAGSVADENMDFSSLVGRYVCVLEEGNPSLWWAAKVVKLNSTPTSWLNCCTRRPDSKRRGPRRTRERRRARRPRRTSMNFRRLAIESRYNTTLRITKTTTRSFQPSSTTPSARRRPP